MAAVSLQIHPAAKRTKPANATEGPSKGKANSGSAVTSKYIPAKFEQQHRSYDSHKSLRWSCWSVGKGRGSPSRCINASTTGTSMVSLVAIGSAMTSSRCGHPYLIENQFSINQTSHRDEQAAIETQHRQRIRARSHSALHVYCTPIDQRSKQFVKTIRHLATTKNKKKMSDSSPTAPRHDPPPRYFTVTQDVPL